MLRTPSTIELSRTLYLFSTVFFFLFFLWPSMSLTVLKKKKKNLHHISSKFKKKIYYLTASIGSMIMTFLCTLILPSDPHNSDLLWDFYRWLITCIWEARNWKGLQSFYCFLKTLRAKVLAFLLLPLFNTDTKAWSVSTTTVLS